MNLGKPIAKGNTSEYIYLQDGKVIKPFNDFLPDTRIGARLSEKVSSEKAERLINIVKQYRDYQ